MASSVKSTESGEIPRDPPSLDPRDPGPPAPDEYGSIGRNISRLGANLREAVFRSGKPTSDRGRTQKIFANLFLHVHSTRVHLYSLRFRATMGLGIAVLAGFLVAAVTGVLLMIYYTPSTELAYSSIKDIHFTVPTGRFIRNIHRWSAHVMVIAVILHAVRVFLTAGYKKPREFNWLIGLGLLCLTLGLSFTGYLLPWDQLAYWAATIGANIAGSPRELTDALGLTRFFDPGGFIKQLMLGADAVGQPALIRFYLLHVMVLPIVLVALLGVHFWRIRKDGGLARPGDDELERMGLIPAPGIGNPAGDAFQRISSKTYGLMALVRGRSHAVGCGPENTVPAYPVALRAETAVSMIVVAVCLLLALLWDAPLKEQANALLPENPAKAPWYFLGIQELVSFSAFTGGVVLPGLVLFGLALIPFLDRERERGGVWFSGRKGLRVFLSSLAAGLVFTLAVEWAAIRFKGLRHWFPDCDQLWIILVNPGTVLALSFAAWAAVVLKGTRSTRMAAIALFTCILVGFVVLTWIGTVHRGPNWEFFWNPGDWPTH